MKIDLTQTVQALVGLLAVIITTFIVPWLKQKIGAHKFDEIKRWVEVAVKAAEQLYQGGGRGLERYNYVVKFLQSKGFDIDGDSIKNLIESTVGDLLNMQYIANVPSELISGFAETKPPDTPEQVKADATA